jgi:hypothetical protein
MKKQGPGSGAVEGGHDLASHNTGFADTTDNHPSTRSADHIDHFHKPVIDMGDQIEYSFGFNP